MNKGLQLFAYSILSLFILAGCGTSANDSTKDGTPPENTPEISDQPAEENEQAENITEIEHDNKDAKTDDSQQAESDKIRLLEQNLSFELRGKTYEDTA